MTRYAYHGEDGRKYSESERGVRRLLVFVVRVVVRAVVRVRAVVSWQL